MTLKKIVFFALFASVLVFADDKVNYYELYGNQFYEKGYNAGKEKYKGIGIFLGSATIGAWVATNDNSIGSIIIAIPLDYILIKSSYNIPPKLLLGIPSSQRIFFEVGYDDFVRKRRSIASVIGTAAGVVLCLSILK